MSNFGPEDILEAFVSSVVVVMVLGVSVQILFGLNINEELSILLDIFIQVFIGAFIGVMLVNLVEEVFER